MIEIGNKDYFLISLSIGILISYLVVDYPKVIFKTKEIEKLNL